MCNHYQQIVKIMQLAHEKIQYPRIHLNNGYVLQRASTNSKFPGSINITDGKPFGSNVWYGRISTSGVLNMPNYMQKHGEKLQYELDLFQIDPAKYASCYGKATANCMFCYKELTNVQSIAVGYGPICASNYGLPYGEIDKETAKNMSELQFELEKPSNEVRLEPALIKEAELHNTAYNGNRTNCDCGRYPPNMECIGNDKCGHIRKLMIAKLWENL